MKFSKFGKLLHYDNVSLGVGNIKRFTFFECKYFGGVILNIFNTNNQDRFHSHAFHSISFMLRGFYNEDVIENGNVITKHITPCIRYIPKNYIHKITNSSKNALSITFETPWDSTWNEYFSNGRIKTHTWGREVLFDSKYIKWKRNEKATKTEKE
jgi:hypothetical protein